MKKSTLLNSVKLALAGVVLTAGVAACSSSEKHNCGAKNGCASKADAKAKCSSKTTTKRVFEEK